MAGTTGSDRDPNEPGYGLPQAVPRPPNRPKASGPQEVRPALGGRDGAEVLKIAGWWGTAIAFVLIAMPVALAMNGDPWLWGMVIDIPIALAAAGAGVLALLYFRNQRVGLERELLYRVGTFGGRRRWPLHDLTKVVRVQAIAGTGLSSESMDLPTSAILHADLVIDKRGQAVESFTGAWPREAMTMLWQEAGLPIRQPWAKPVGIDEIRHRYPGAVATLQRPYDDSLSVRSVLLLVGTIFGFLVLAFIVFWVAAIIAASR